MKERVKYALKKLQNGFFRLKEGIEQVKDELDKDGVIQRFEFTFELLWKTLKIFLEYKGLEVKTPRDSFKESFRINLLEDEEIFLDMLEDRNRTTNVYEQSISEEIFERIRTIYILAIERILFKIKEEIKVE